MDDDEDAIKNIFNSELGQELLRLQSCSKHQLLDATLFKDINVTAEDVRIATRLSELSYAILDKKLLTAQSRQIANLRLDLGNGQQCVRDFFICLNENLISLPIQLNVHHANIETNLKLHRYIWKYQFLQMGLI